ncbi:MAG TPA: DUF1194 domain-containing protein [Paracoccaceae bacterium]|nr:DUF1194 domain-containing protein [Paracoccaceae bacterium]
MRWVAALLLLALPAAAEVVDVELVFAVDTSRSMDYDEQVVQREGYAEALSDPAVFEAIRSGPHRKIVIAYFEWGGPWSHRTVLDWTMIATREDALAAAAALRAVPIESSSGTSISGGLSRAAEMIDSNGYEGLRRVIDISGDGPNNTGDPVTPVRDLLVARGFEINGLPVMVKRAGGLFNLDQLDIYYEDCVIGGPAAFVVPIRSKEEFAPSIRRKMVLEITGIGPGPKLRAAQTSDCLVGEKLRRQWLELQGGG